MSKVQRIPTLSPISLENCRKLFVKDANRCIRPGWIHPSDMGKTIQLDDQQWTIIGGWDSGKKNYNDILLRTERGALGFADPQDVAKAMGFKKVRNLITGEPLTWSIDNTSGMSHIATREADILEAEVTEELPDEWKAINVDGEEEEDLTEDDNPLVRAVAEQMREEGE
jgi:hypothetical protein